MWKDAEAVKENEVHLKNPTTQQLFKGYFFDKSHHLPTASKSTTGGNENDTQGNVVGGKTLNSSAGFSRMLPPEGVKSIKTNEQFI